MSTDKFGRYRPIVAAQRTFFTAPLNNLNMSRKRIQQLGDPELDHDAANKKYVMETTNRLSEDITALEKKILLQLDRKIIEAGQHVDSLYAQTVQMVEGALNICVTKNEMNHKIDEIVNTFNTNINVVRNDLTTMIKENASVNELNQAKNRFDSRFKKLDTKIDNILSEIKTSLPQPSP
ncbi:hypothetical protein QE152_g7668 [Popillia japonica]|uniref:Uncharacterized protein n=1 Tax=Popillia japonica TaxID=7064 RepID=A0AAW1M967_POPJA